MKALRLHGIGDIRVDEVPIPEPRGKELLVKVGACGICGSDIPRVFSHGSSNGKYPLTIGHEFSGEVVAVGADADDALIGARGAVYPLIPCRVCDPCVAGHFAMCEHYDYLGSRRDGGFAEYCLLPSEWHFIRSEGADLQALSMTEPACVAQHAIRRANVTAGSYVVIFGAGPIGILAARWARIFGAEVLLVDISPDAVAFAREKGFAAIHSREVQVADEILKRNGGRLADAAIEGTGAGAVLASCIECVRARGAVALLGNPAGASQMPERIHSMVLRKEIAINGVWNSSRAPYPVDEWAYTVRMMDSGALTLTDLITDVFTLDQMPRALAEIKNGTRRVTKAICV